jgi:DNA-binding NarL/FixJ family response regulator
MTHAVSIMLKYTLMEKGKIKLVLAGFHELFCDGLKLFLKKYPHIELVAYTSDTTKVLRLLKTHHPNVVLVDTEAAETQNFNVTEVIHKYHPSTAIIMFCAVCEEVQVVHQIKVGAKGVLFKDCGKEEVVKAIKAVVEKQTHYCPSASKTLLNLFSQQLDPSVNAKPSFTTRELSIIKLLCKEYTNKEIADMLSLSMRTVEEYRTNILKKIGAKSGVGIALYALRNNLVS